MVTRFDKDYLEAEMGNADEVLARRKREIKKLTAEAKKCRNHFITLCINQEIAKLKRECREIEEAFC